MDARQMKIKAAEAALSHVQDGMRLGIGTGSTAEEFVRLLAEKVAAGLKVEGVPTSERTARLCVELGVPLKSLDELPELDLTIDGADEVDHALRLVKGGGGALLREKIVAAASGRMIVIADQSKVVETLGAFPLPIEINPFGQVATRIAIEKLASRSGLSGGLTMRSSGDGAFKDQAPFQHRARNVGRLKPALLGKDRIARDIRMHVEQRSNGRRCHIGLAQIEPLLAIGDLDALDHRSVPSGCSPRNSRALSLTVFRRVSACSVAGWWYPFSKTARR